MESTDSPRNWGAVGWAGLSHPSVVGVGEDLAQDEGGTEASGVISDPRGSHCLRPVLHGPRPGGQSCEVTALGRFARPRSSTWLGRGRVVRAAGALDASSTLPVVGKVGQDALSGRAQETWNSL